MKVSDRKKVLLKAEIRTARFSNLSEQNNILQYFDPTFQTIGLNNLGCNPEAGLKVSELEASNRNAITLLNRSVKAIMLGERISLSVLSQAVRNISVARMR